MLPPGRDSMGGSDNLYISRIRCMKSKSPALLAGLSCIAKPAAMLLPDP
jgi:hypothetical protein